MKNAALLVFTIAVLALLATACGSSRQAATTQSQPKGGATAEGLALKMLGGHPKPAFISYHRGQKMLTVTLRFSHAVVCTGCPVEQAVIQGRIVPSPLIHARSATIAIDPRTHRMTSFSLGRR